MMLTRRAIDARNRQCDLTIPGYAAVGRLTAAPSISPCRNAGGSKSSRFACPSPAASLLRRNEAGGVGAYGSVGKTERWLTLSHASPMLPSLYYNLEQAAAASSQPDPELLADKTLAEVDRLPLSATTIDSTGGFSHKPIG